MSASSTTRERASRARVTPHGRGASADVLRVTVVRSSLGLVLLASSPVGLVALLMGDHRDALHRALRRRFPLGSFLASDATLDALANKVLSLIDNPATPFDAPLDARGTPFQRDVWQALRDIPMGTTTTYGTLAARLGRPGSARAVGAACADNPIAVVIPCHRVVARNGDLTGYAWGVYRKRALLEREAAAARR